MNPAIVTNDDSALEYVGYVSIFTDGFTYVRCIGVVGSGQYGANIDFPRVPLKSHDFKVLAIKVVSQ